MFATEEKLSKFETEEAIKTFNYIREGLQSSYPLGYFNGSKGALRLKTIMEYYLYEEMKYTEDEAVQAMSLALFKEIGLANAVKCLGGVSKRETIFKMLFPNRHVWEMPIIPKPVWTEEVKKEFCIWFLEEYNTFNKDTILDEIDTEEVFDRIDPVIRRPFSKFTGLAEVISIAYDMDKEMVKTKLKSKVTSKTMERFYSKYSGTSVKQEPIKPKVCKPKENMIAPRNETYAHLYMLYYTQKDNFLECELVGGSSTEEVRYKSDMRAKELGAVKYWLERLA